MKHFDIKSAIVGALLMLVITLAVAGARSGHTPWEYKIVYGYFGNPDQIGDNINVFAGQGWEFVSASGPNNGNQVVAVMRREKR